LYIYRSPAGRRAVVEWCDRELERQVPAAERCTIDSPLGSTHLTTLGRGPRHVLFLPGTNMSAATSIPLLRTLARNGRVTVADEPGQPGLSAGHRPDADLVNRYGAWVDHLVTVVGDTTIVLAGESRGAAVALCATPEDRIGGLVLVSPAGLVGARVPPAVLRASVPWLVRPTVSRSARLLTTMYGSSTVVEHDRLSEWMTVVACHVRTSFAPQPLPNVVVPPWRQVPQQVLLGEHDRYFPPRQVAPAATALLHIEPTVVCGGGHLLSHTNPGAIGAAALALARCGGEPR
jgi:pimeloyl-ACP methyl ester carboxylesterase